MRQPHGSFKMLSSHAQDQIPCWTCATGLVNNYALQVKHVIVARSSWSIAHIPPPSLLRYKLQHLLSSTTTSSSPMHCFHLILPPLLPAFTSSAMGAYLLLLQNWPGTRSAKAVESHSGRPKETTPTLFWLLEKEPLIVALQGVTFIVNLFFDRTELISLVKVVYANSPVWIIKDMQSILCKDNSKEHCTFRGAIICNTNAGWEGHTRDGGRKPKILPHPRFWSDLSLIRIGGGGN